MNARRTSGRRRRAAPPVLGRRLAGVAFLLVPALLIWLSIAVYNKRFTDVVWVTLKTASVGSEMHPHADVKLRGVPVGEVREIDSDGRVATLRLAIDPERVRMLPANVSAQLLPTTLFGARYVALIPPAQPVEARLVAGSVISQDRSANAIELQRVLDNLYPLLTAVQPAKLAATLTAVSQALDGRGGELGETLVELDAYLKEINPSVPALNRGIKELVQVTHHYEQAAPDILQALNDFSYTSRSIAAQRADLGRLYASLTDASQDLSDFLHENSENFIRLTAEGRPTLELLREYSPAFPCTLEMLTDFVPVMDEVLGAGTDHPGLHVNVETVPSKGKYVPGRDRPRYTEADGPHCYPVPYGTGGGETLAAAPPDAASPVAVAPGALGLPNSPQENRMVNELLAPSVQEVPEALPGWSSVLLGPLYRGAEVTLK
ncbi:MCE family protein [Actinomadura algeriensis]|uniref:Phospholipid/cholesterol/gamma-HCH transport system substrate-binding protein n=1 Tax=Actinomadura algeriensis TaxID=1679523 RepID=A0ABR9JMJ9_9ACTN|nr:MCE family protein [Actinomadura algeriensis]MBE1531791.1 phospholipid/cholesterol/gamma-HCH transport system substrate-binding protein [Actinomadura algeriensis]